MNEWIIVGIVAIAVIFGATKLPEIARNLGRSSGRVQEGPEGRRATRTPAAADAGRRSRPSPRSPRSTDVSPPTLRPQGPPRNTWPRAAPPGSRAIRPSTPFTNRRRLVRRRAPTPPPPPR